MIDTRLILLEGLPGTGKSTNTSFLVTQLQRNDISTRWVHEVARPHPASYFNEACLSNEEYEQFIKEFPHTKKILEEIGIKRRNTIGIDLLELKWNYNNDFGEAALKRIEEYDVWNFDLDKYEEVSLEKWEYFTRDAMKQTNQVIVMESSIFQFQIFTFLLKNASYERFEEFIRKLFQIISPLKPALIYLYRRKTEDSIVYLEQERGIKSLEGIWERDKNEPFYEDRPKGAEGYRQFLLYYGEWANNLFHMAPCNKLSIEITNGNWLEYEKEMLSFINIQRLPAPYTNTYCGIYRNEILNIQMEINELDLIDASGVKRILIPKAKDQFYIHCLPAYLRFINTDEIVVEGEQILERWTTRGTVFKRV